MKRLEGNRDATVRKTTEDVLDQGIKEGVYRVCIT